MLNFFFLFFLFHLYLGKMKSFRVENCGISTSFKNELYKNIGLFILFTVQYTKFFPIYCGMLNMISVKVSQTLQIEISRLE